MELSKVDFYFLMIYSIIYVEAGLNPEKDNVCLKTITYNETIKEVAHRPASTRDKVNCLKKNNYCDEEINTDVKESRVITRTKILPSCCEGYEEDPEGTQCVPVCPNGCGSGKCIAPGNCSCEAGFFGPECDKTCDEGRWGKNCIFECNCSEKEVCNKIFGCMCKPGWIGERCTISCPVGYYGFLCEEKCSCGVSFCDHVTGVCIESSEDVNNLRMGEGDEINGKPRIGSSNVRKITENQRLLEFSEVHDRVTGSISSADASQNEKFNKQPTPSIRVKDEPAISNPPYFKSGGVEEGEKVKQIVQSESLIPVHQTNYTPVHYLANPVGFSKASTILNTPENANTTDFLKELTTNLTVLKENIFQRNELTAGASDSHTTPDGSVQSSRVSSFIPTFTVLSSVAFLIILIIGKRLAIIFRKKITKMTDVELGSSNEELSILPSEKFIWENTLENPVSVTHLLNAVPILQTFKPGVPQNENMSTEKKVSRIAECLA